MAFGERGRRLHDAYAAGLDARGLVLLEEAARIADRLDKLDALLCGDADVWCRLVHNTRTEDYELHIDSALSEARQQAAVLRQLLGALSVEEPDDGGTDDWIEDVYASLRNAEGRDVPDAGAAGRGGSAAAG